MKDLSKISKMIWNEYILETSQNPILRLVSRKMATNLAEVEEEYVGAHYCCIGFSMHDLTRDYLIGHPAYDAGHPLSAEFRFSGTSLDRLDMLAEEHGLLEDDLVQHRSFDDFMLWWSGFHEVEGCPDCTQDKICISCYDPVTRKKTE